MGFLDGRTSSVWSLNGGLQGMCVCVIVTQRKRKRGVERKVGKRRHRQDLLTPTAFPGLGLPCSSLILSVLHP